MLIIPGYKGKVPESSKPGTPVLLDEGAETPFQMSVHDPDLVSHFVLEMSVDLSHLVLKKTNSFQMSSFSSTKNLDSNSFSYQASVCILFFKSQSHPMFQEENEMPPYVYELTTPDFKINEEGVLVVASSTLDRDPPHLPQHTFQVTFLFPLNFACYF